MPADPKAIIYDGILRQLRMRWWRAVGLYVLVLFGGFYILEWEQPWFTAVQSIFQSTVCMIYVLGLLRYGLRWNYHPKQKVLLSTLGYGTWLTIIRGGLMAVLAGYLFQSWPASRIFPGGLSWVPGLLYLAASILDFLDGLVARACRHETRLGAFLDINLDALGLLIAPLVGIWYGQLPTAYLSVSFAYYVFRAAIRLRKKYALPVVAPKPWPAARVVAGFQMGLVGIALLPVIRPPITTVAAYVFMIPLLAVFIRDWLIVCGYGKSGFIAKIRL